MNFWIYRMERVVNLSICALDRTAWGSTWCQSFKHPRQQSAIVWNMGSVACVRNGDCVPHQKKFYVATKYDHRLVASSALFVFRFAFEFLAWLIYLHFARGIRLAFVWTCVEIDIRKKAGVSIQRISRIRRILRVYKHISNLNWALEKIRIVNWNF